MGQAEGAFVFGLGLFMTEKVIYDATTGRLLTNGTWVSHGTQAQLRVIAHVIASWFKAPAKRGHVVAATFCPTMLPVPGKTRQHCCAPRGRKKNVSEDFQNIFCVQDADFVSATSVARVAKRVNVWETWSR